VVYSLLNQNTTIRRLNNNSHRPAVSHPLGRTSTMATYKPTCICEALDSGDENINDAVLRIRENTNMTRPSPSQTKDDLLEAAVDAVRRPPPAPALTSVYEG
jgi:hypothetical protein